ncbi:MAG: hypothetical protein MUP80_02090 [Acidobacteriia bacterium]|nr:hypothetical protein [Terriglobia bacterium]
MMTQFHPAPGMGITLPGVWAVPQNPIMDGAGPALAVIPHMSGIMAANFRVPENPLLRDIYGCGVAGLCGGLGEATSPTDLVSQVLGKVTSGDWTTWAMVGGGAILLFMLLGSKGGSAKRGEIAEARARYKEQVGKIRRKYPRGYQRIGRAFEAAAE